MRKEEGLTGLQSMGPGNWVRPDAEENVQGLKAQENELGLEIPSGRAG